MQYLIVFLYLLPLQAQSELPGLGWYRIGLTTPDSLSRRAFTEQEQAYVKGTLALPCTHIRSFRAAKVDLDTLSVTNLVLFFYDDKLFKISCDYSDELRQAFVLTYGKGVSRPSRRFTCCAQSGDKVTLIWGETWQQGDTQALAIYTNGYNTDCQPEKTGTLVMASQHVSALSSDCDLRNANPYIEVFEKGLTEK